MDTTTAPAAFLLKCRCGLVRRYTTEERDAARAPWDHSKNGGTACPACDKCAKFTPIKARVTETECGPRCTSALGPSCDCKCGGANHAADHH